jgi:hypothetical protein
MNSGRSGLRRAAAAVLLVLCLMAGYLMVRPSRHGDHTKPAPPERTTALTSARGHVDYLARMPSTGPRRLTIVRRRSRTRAARSDPNIHRDSPNFLTSGVALPGLEAPAAIESAAESLHARGGEMLESARTINWQVFAAGSRHGGPTAGAVSPRERGVPGAMTTIYIAFGLLQALDVHSTRMALKAGAIEANPLMARVAGHPVAFIGIKAASAADRLCHGGRQQRPRGKPRARAPALTGTYNTGCSHSANRFTPSR